MGLNAIDPQITIPCRGKLFLQVFPMRGSQEILFSIIAEQFKVTSVDVIKCLLYILSHMRERFQGPEKK